MRHDPLLTLPTRHGARLDAADSQWHLTSPTPYDPPLTYGGWRQSQALGARIASILDDREAAEGPRPLSDFESGSDTSGDGVRETKSSVHPSRRLRRRKHKVVIHSSPFQRCIQTSLAIGAGMAQYQGNTKAKTYPSPANHRLHSGLPHIRAIDHGRSSPLTAIPEPDALSTSRRGVSSKSHPVNERPFSRGRTLLRVDAFLGEWLSPDYFDKITPPPESKLMVAGAKADLLRDGDPIDSALASSRNASTLGNFPGGWGSPSTKDNAVDEATPFTDLSSIGQALPKLSRANSHSVGVPTLQSKLNVNGKDVRSPSQKGLRYVPPVPSYAVSPSQPIPQGYVAHARDACIKVDFQWDSLRPPLEWGDGGAFGEEWSSMHKRFRRGLHEMISWYQGHDPVALVRTLSQGLPEEKGSNQPNDDQTDTVLVLVTHGSGCNALIGALTNQPVLIDVGMASLTMAERKTKDYRRVASPSAPTSNTSPSRRRNSGFDFGVSDDYEVKITASTDHLRPGSSFLAANQIQRSSTMPTREKSPYRYERPHLVDSRHRKVRIDEDQDFQSDSDNATQSKKDQISAPNGEATAAATPLLGGGLWTKPAPPADREVAATDLKHAIKVPIPHFDGALDVLPNGTGKRAKSASDKKNQDHSIAPGGLWGAPPHALANERDAGAKRRWTLSQAA